MATKRHRKAQNVPGIIFLVIFCASFWLIAFPVFAEEARDPTLQLAVKLAGDGDHHGAAVEFRRLALASSDPKTQGACYWSAAHEYWMSKDLDAEDRMLNQAEDASPELRSEALLLRTERELSLRSWETASFYSQSLLDSPATAELKTLAARKLAAARLQQKNVPAAREALSKSPTNLGEATTALDTYAAGHDKKPKVGGLLGMIPGCGYFYSGEYANGLRSILLNGLFIYGMADTANHDQWGAFTVITFFEFTWYSGSIYGGIDAAHRYNRNRLDSAMDAINGESGFEPDYQQLPTLVLQFRF